MAFKVKNWVTLSSSANTKVSTLQDGSLVGGPTMFGYISVTDTLATMLVADYFVAQAPILSVTDLIYAAGTDTEQFITVAGVNINTPSVITTSVTPASGDVDGPGSSTDNAIARFNGITGKIIQNSAVIVSDLDAITGVTALTVDNLNLDGNTISSTNAGGDIVVNANTTGAFEIASNATKAGIFRMREPAGSGVNFISFQTPALAANTDYTWPNAFPLVSGYQLTSTVAGVMSWELSAPGAIVDQTTTPQSMIAGTVYSANIAGLLTFTMPATAAFGDYFEVIGQGAGGWLIQMNTGQTANASSGSTSVAGSLASTNRYNSIKLMCTVANTTFTVSNAEGTITNA